MAQDFITINENNQPKLSYLLDFSPTIIYCAVPSGDFRITYISNNLHDILGYAPHEIYADDNFWHDHIHPEDRPTVFSNLTQLFTKDSYVIDYRFLHKDGHYLSLHDQLRLIRNSDGDAIDIVGSLTNITKLKQAEQSLIEGESRLKSIFDTAQDGIITIDMSGTIESINPAAANIFGYNENELPGKNVSVLMPETIALEHDGYLLHFEQTRQTNFIGSGSREVTAKHKDGREFLLELAIDHINYGDEDHFVGIFRDISQRKEIELELYQYSTRMTELVRQRTVELEVARDEALAAEKAMSVFLSNMSHELRTPLHGILSFANFGIKKYRRVPLEKLCQYFTEIHDSGKQLLGLINDLLDLSKLRAGKMIYDYQIAQLDKVAREVIHEMRILAYDKKIKIKYECENVPAETMMDITKIAQVIRNLLSNAIKFSPEKSVITIIIYTDSNSALCLQVSDQGVGIPEQEFELIFDVFSQSSKTRTNAGGTGLGLPICKEIIKQGHAGKIAAQSGINGGAVFTVTLPVRDNVNQGGYSSE